MELRKSDILNSIKGLGGKGIKEIYCDNYNSFESVMATLKTANFFKDHEIQCTLQEKQHIFIKDWMIKQHLTIQQLKNNFVSCTFVLVKKSNQMSYYWNILIKVKTSKYDEFTNTYRAIPIVNNDVCVSFNGQNLGKAINLMSNLHNALSINAREEMKIIASQNFFQDNESEYEFTDKSSDFKFFNIDGSKIEDFVDYQLEVTNSIIDHQNSEVERAELMNDRHERSKTFPTKREKEFIDRTINSGREHETEARSILKHPENYIHTWNSDDTYKGVNIDTSMVFDDKENKLNNPVQLNDVKQENLVPEKSGDKSTESIVVNSNQSTTEGLNITKEEIIIDEEESSEYVEVFEENTDFIIEDRIERAYVELSSKIDFRDICEDFYDEFDVKLSLKTFKELNNEQIEKFLSDNNIDINLEL